MTSFCNFLGDFLLGLWPLSNEISELQTNFLLNDNKISENLIKYLSFQFNIILIKENNIKNYK